MQIYVNRYELYSWVKTYIDMKFQNCEPAGTQLSSHHFFCLVLNHHCLWATACIFSAAKQIKATKSFAFLDCVGMTLFGYGFEILARLTAFV